VQENQHNISKRSNIQLDFLADSQNHNLLFHACESGNVPVVGFLLKYGINPDSSEISLQDMVWQHRYSDVLLKLLRVNLPFPATIDITECSENLKTFIKLSTEFHELIKCNNQQRLDEILNQYTKMCYFYNLSNESALKTTLDSRNIKIYEFLVARNLTFAPHEDTDKIWASLNLTDKEDLNTIHLKYLKNLPEKHINILMANTSLSHDENDDEGKMKLIQNAFRVLNKEQNIKILLQIVAASKKFHIVFDFYRDSTYRIDPTTSAYTTGIFYFTGRILIGAKQLLDPATEHEALGTLAHELCHCAMNILYENKTNPYPQNDRKAVEIFEKISQNCKDKMDVEKLIKDVYENYPKSHQHAELIVRPAHIMAHFMNQPKILQEKRDIFIEIFDYFENFVVPAMKNILPEIEDRFAYKPAFVYNKLSELNRNKVQKAFVKYKNVKLKFCDLFSCGSVPYDKLTSDHISQFLDNKVLNLGDPHMHYLEKLVTFEWKKLTEKLKQKLLCSYFNFQNVNVKFQNLEILCPESFNALTSEQIINILNGHKMIVGEKFKPESEFYVDRKFMPEDGKQIFFEYEYGHEYVHDRSIEEEHKRTRQALLNKSFEEFTEEFLSQDLDTRTNIIEKVKDNYLYKIRYYDLSGDYISYMHRNMTDVVEQTKNDKIFILSSEAGAGKTVSFEHLTVQIKNQYPTKWVSYIDLKDHTKFYIQSAADFQEFFKNSENIEHLLRNIVVPNSSRLGPETLKNSRLGELSSTQGSVGLNLNSNFDFETNIFSESFKSGNVVILWNGFDEISPTYNEFVLNLIKFIYKNTKIIQYICTRPLHSRQLFDAFRIRTWQLVPFNENEKMNFLSEFFISKNVKVEQIGKFTSKVLEIAKKFEFEHKVFRDFNTPLILKLIAEIHEDEKLFASANLYGIFETFVRKKVRIWIEKSEFARKTSENLIIRSSKFSIIEIFQKFAFFKEFKILSGTTLGLKFKKLQLIQKKIPKDLPLEEISRMGILYIDGENQIEFSHRTFGEFFIAQYFIENIYLAEDDINVDEAELRLEIFIKILNQYGFVKIIIDFMDYYLKMENEDDNKSLSDTFSDLLRTKFKRIFMNLLNTNHIEIFNFLFKFFKRDHDLLVELLHVYEDETFYTEIYNPNNFSIAIDPQEVETLVKNYLSNEELEHFLTGRNQTGKVLTGIYFYKSMGILKTNDRIDLNLLDNDINFWDFIEKIKVYLTLEEQKELFCALISPKIFLYYNDKIFHFSDEVVDFSENNRPNNYFKEIANASDVSNYSKSGAKTSSRTSKFVSFFKSSRNLLTKTKMTSELKNTKFTPGTSKCTNTQVTANNLSGKSRILKYLPPNNPETSKTLFLPPQWAKSTISIHSDDIKYQNMWTTFENLQSSEEIQNAIGNAIMDYLEIYGGKKSAGNFFLSFLFNKCEQFLTDSQIFEMFLSKNILHEASRGNFEVMWKFICKHSTKSERKEILFQDNENDEKNFYFYYYPEGEIKRKFSNYPFYYYYFDFTPFKIFHRFMTVSDAASFDIIKDIYQQHFRKTEIQKIILSSNDFLYYLIGRVLAGPCTKFVTFLEEIFDGNKKLLKEYLDRQIKPTNLNIFQYFNDFKGTNEVFYFENLQIFTELYKKLST